MNNTQTKRLIMDLDNTLTIDSSSDSYNDKQPNHDVINKLKQYKNDGFEIVIVTARNMRTYDGSIGKINIHTLPTVMDWLNRHEVPYDEVYVGKPWCGEGGFYVDDMSIRPSEFIQLTREQIYSLLQNEGKR